jgi:acetyltransferase-like isoleucine patch superfamily enzyme
MSERLDTVVVDLPERSSGQMGLKRLVQGLCSLWVWPRVLSFRLWSKVWGTDRAFLAASESISRIPGMRGVYLRQAFYRRALHDCGRDAYIGFGTLFSMTAASVGERAYLGRRCSIGFAEIRDDAILADDVTVLSGGREHGAPGQGERPGEHRQVYEKVVIGEGAWIGSGAVIMASVGAGAMVGAGAVVNRPIAERTLAAGVPAREIRPLDGRSKP